MKGAWIPLPLWITNISYQLPLADKFPELPLKPFTPSSINSRIALRAPRSSISGEIRSAAPEQFCIGVAGYVAHQFPRMPCPNPILDLLPAFV
jgi:hypothetical protein